ncbi:DNA methylase [Patescibacteria group bacterium]|nr:DNA methylase [Patescibacteria group bacterium]
MTRQVLKSKPQHHPEDYGLDVMTSEDDLFRWFLLAYLLGKPIQSTVAVNTWKLFIEQGIDTPWAIMSTKERKLAHLLVEGKYTRYNHVMAKALLTMSKQLIDRYDGSLMLMISLSETETEFGKRLQELYGIGPKTAEIIMRETEEYFASRVE